MKLQLNYLNTNAKPTTLKILFTIFLLFINAVIFGQDTTYNKRLSQSEFNHKLILSPGLSYQGQLLGELNLMYSKPIEGHFTLGNFGPRLGFEANLNPNHFIYAPKLGYEIGVLLFVVRGNIVSYIDRKKVDLRFIPEIGLSFLGAINLTYGYGIPLLTYETTSITRNRITLTVNLDSRLLLWSTIKEK